ncbi:mechanosensitive ion channel domain-containing protein [Flavobacterium sp. j3]|uniref:Mechanosensitive ion channel domain-containing protein n=1 Tax=Flavobacterium aureirubrum TaxID=3133147 RepID=A0ABU9N8K1_9FLAO
MLYINSFSTYADTFLNVLIDYSPRIISAFVILFLGLYAIRIINRLVKKMMLKRELEPTLSKFLADILLWVLRILLFVSFISKLGIETSSFVAVLGAAGLAVGLSLQGSLSNFAGGMLIILFKPFRVGDTISAQGVIGTVSEIQIFVTKLITVNNQTIFIPNGILSNGVITNYSIEGICRADLVFSLSYETNIKTAKEIVMQVMHNQPQILKNPEPTVVVKNLTDNSILLGVYPWSKNQDAITTSSDVYENCLTEFHKAGIIIQPFAREASKE